MTYYNTPSACNDGYADDVNQILPGLSRQKEDKKKAFPISERIGWSVQNQRNQILAIHPLPSIETICELVRQEQRQNLRSFKESQCQY